MAGYAFSYPSLNYKINDWTDNKQTAIYSLLNMKVALDKEIAKIEDQITSLVME